MFQHGIRVKRVLQDRLHGGYFYSVGSTKGQIMYLECKEKLLENCPATGSIVGDQFTPGRAHNHPADGRLKQKYRFKKELYTAVTSSLRSYRVIYDKACLKNSTGAALVPFQDIEGSMLRWRSDVCPPVPRSWENYAELLRTEEWQKFTTYDGGRLSVSTVRSVDESIVVVYGDVEFLTSINPVHLYLDATFKVCPRIPRVLQLLTIMAQLDDSTVPIAWALMERKTKDAYHAVLQYFSSVLAPHIRPTSFMTDFETALADAMHIVYPEATHQCCYFHYSQALMRKAKKLHLLQRIQNCENKQIIFRHLLALALLPANDIVEAFHWIVVNTNPENSRFFERFFLYVQNYWLQRVTPQRFSVNGMACKTNNSIESYHRVLGIRMGSHPSVWQFTEDLRRLQVVVRSSRESLDLGIPIGRPSAERDLIQPRIIHRAWELYAENLLDIPRFLACAGCFLGAFNHRNVITTVDQVDAFVNLDVIG